MTDSQDPEIPDFATLAADPEIAPLLHFGPVVRKVKRPDGWTPDLQRELIARLAATGTLQAAVWQMGKQATGAEALYKTPSATSFRQSWDAAILIGRRRNHLDSAPPHAGPVPGISRRSAGSSPPAGESGRGWTQVEDDPPEPDEDQKWDLIYNIGVRFMRKVAAERHARLNGEIVAADFYLRQITGLEVMFDLSSQAMGWNAADALRKLRRGGHDELNIVTTPLADWLDRSRRLWWAQVGDRSSRPTPTSASSSATRPPKARIPPISIRTAPARRPRRRAATVRRNGRSNKRTAAVVSETFLILNGCQLDASDAELVVAFLALAAGELSEGDMAGWVLERVAEATP